MQDKEFLKVIEGAIRYDSRHGAHLELHPIPGKEGEFLIFKETPQLSILEGVKVSVPDQDVDHRIIDRLLFGLVRGVVDCESPTSRSLKIPQDPSR